MSVDGAVVLHRVELEAKATVETAHGAHGGRPLYLLSVDGPGPGFAEVVGLPSPAPGDPGIEEVVDALTTYVLPLLAERSSRRGSVGAPGQLRPSLNAERATSFACHAVEALLLDRWSRATGSSLLEHLAGRSGSVPLRRSWLLDVLADPPVEPGDRLRAKVNPANALDRARELRERFGDVELALDANGSFSELGDAERLALADRLAEVPSIALEQPLARGDIVGHAQLRERGLRIYLDESASSLQAIRTIARYEAADGLVLKPARLGGAVATVQALAECQALGLAAAVGGMLEAELGRAVLRTLAAHPGATLAGDVGPSLEYLSADPTASATAARPLAQASHGFGVDASEACRQATEVARFPLALGEPLDT